MGDARLWPVRFLAARCPDRLLGCARFFVCFPSRSRWIHRPGSIRLDLGEGHLVLDDQAVETGGLGAGAGLMPEAQVATWSAFIASGLQAIGEMEGALAAHGGLGIDQGIEDHLIGADAGQEQVFAAPVHQLAHLHMGPLAPQEGVELVADGAGAQLFGEEVFLGALLGSSFSQRPLAATEPAFIP